MHFKKTISMLLCIAMLISMMPCAFADYNSPVKVTSEAAVFNVLMPTVLPVNVDAHGNISVSTDAKITNSSWGPVYVSGLSVKSENGWSVANYDNTMYKEKVNATKIGMVLNDCKTTTAGGIDYSYTRFQRLEGRGGKNQIGLVYNANLPAQNTAANKVIPMDVIFTVSWLDENAPDDVPQNTSTQTSYGLTLTNVVAPMSIGDTGSVEAAQDTGNIKWSNSDSSVVEMTSSSPSVASLATSALCVTAMADDSLKPITSKVNLKALNVGKSTITAFNDVGEQVSTDVWVIKNSITGLQVITMPSKTTYDEGETFDPTGMVLQATYTNGEKYILDAYNYTKDMLTADRTSVDVWYTEQGVKRQISLPVIMRSKGSNPIVSITATTAPTVSSYTEGEIFNPTGMVITATYKNGDTHVVSNYTYPTDALQAGATSVTINYNGKTCTVPISIRAKQLLSIAVSKAPAKTFYVEGQSFDPTGMVVTGNYDNGDAQTVIDYTVDSKVTLGQTVVTISFDGKTCTQEITVVGKSPTGISVKTPAAKTIYTIGDTFDSTGLVLNLNYDNGTSSELSSGFTVNADTSTTTTTSAIITYGNLSCTMPIVVSGPDWDSNPMTSAQVAAKNIIFNKSNHTVYCSHNSNYAHPTGVLKLPSSVDGVKVDGIGYDFNTPGFSDMPGITSVIIPRSFTHIEKASFSNCCGITSVSIPDTVTHIYSAAFDNTRMTSIDIPDSVVFIDDNAFADCQKLTSVTIPSSVTSMGKGVFQNCKALTSAKLLGKVTGYNTFYQDANLASVIIGESATNIDSGTFYNCTGLKSITIPSNITSIGAGAFEYSGLTSITIPDSVTTIDNYAFYSCSGLASATIPSGVTSIGNYAFSKCISLASVTIPSGITSISDYTFSCCSGLKSVTISSGVTSIGTQAFDSCSGLTSITIPSGITSIGTQAFVSCSGLTSITIPNSVTSIGRYAFAMCSGLTSVTIPDSVNSIGDSAFNKVHHIYYHGTATGSPWGATAIN